jgi:hypothetical protein
MADLPPNVRHSSPSHNYPTNINSVPHHLTFLKDGKQRGMVCSAPSSSQSLTNAIKEQYHEYFYVNLLTKQSQWEIPEAPATGGANDSLGAPPSYDSKNAQPLQAEKTGSSTGEQMFGGASSGPQHDVSADEAFARKLQAEEDARAHGGNTASANDRGASDAYYQSGGAPGSYGQQQPQSYGQPQQQYGQPQYGQQDPYAQQQGYAPQQQQQTSSKGGFLSKLLGKGKSRPTSGGYYPPQQPHPSYYNGQQNPYQQPGRRPGGGGMGMGTGLALGAGGGLLGGVLLGEALEGHDGGGDDGGYGGDGGGDGGGDFGGDGGGDFGGGDF